jgi:Carboxypeptidase regulatory-like domain
MLRRKLIADSIIIAILLVFTLQIGMFGLTSASRKIVTGIVYGSSGIPLSAASVYVSGSEGSGHTTTDGNGNYLINDDLPTGNYTVAATKSGYINAEIQNVTITAGHETIVDLFMNRSGTILGKVTDSKSIVGIPNIRVLAVLSSDGGIYFGEGTTDLNGNYEITMNLGTGTYNVSVSSPKGYVPKEVSPIFVEAGNVTTGVNIALDRSGIISGQVTFFPGGEPLADATVTAAGSDGGTYFGTDVTDATGSYIISSGLGTGNYTVTANYQSSSNQTLNVAVTAGQETSNVNIQLNIITPTFSGTITGRVTNASDSQPIAGAQVVAIGDTNNSYASNYTGNDGSYIISQDLKTDNYTVTASAVGYEDANVTMVSVTVNQTTSNVNLRLTKIPPAPSGSISGTVTGDVTPINELEYPIAVMVIITLAGVAAAKLSTRKIKPL